MTLKNWKTHDHKGVFSLFGYVRDLSARTQPLGFALLSGTILAGCGGDQARENDNTQYYTDQSNSVFSDDPGTNNAGLNEDGAIDVSALLNGGDESAAPAMGNAKNDEPIGGWSIVLTKLNGAGMDRAQNMLKIIQNDAGLKDAFIEQRSEGLVIAYGSYLGRDEAMKDLERIRKTRLMSTTPFENAIIAPPSSGELRGSNPMYDLRTAKQRYGEQAVYTLQIGVYGRVDYQSPIPEELAAYRKAAEEAVRDLRGQGEIAFYYHAPARSMVTIGVFGEDDFDNSTLPPYQSPKLKQARDKFPNNLLNGAGINETVRTESGKRKMLQSSQLVAIPEK